MRAPQDEGGDMLLGCSLHALLRPRASAIWRVSPRQNNPPGKSLKTCPAFLRKIFRFTHGANQ
jgi:hypothetical protein